MIKKKNVLVTGARGFIGKNIVEHFKANLSNNYTVFSPYHNELELLDSQVVISFIKSKSIDLIIHCANIGGSRKTAYDQDRTDVVYKNLAMFFNLVGAMNKDTRMVFFGSGAEYARAYYKPKMKEDYFDEHIPEDSYGFSKYVCSKYIESSEKIVNLRLFGVFGKHEDYEFKFISNAIVKNLLGLPITINQNIYFDYLYINDFLKIVEYFIDKMPKQKFYNAARGQTIDLVTIAKEINKVSEKQSEIIVKHEGLNTEYSADNSRLLKEIGNFDFTPFDQAIKELYLWYKSNLNKINKAKITKDEYIKYCHIDSQQ
ncbi:MAG: NAD(P)-dependent oxidoreductase [Candidatus Omnitrophica bacterium]|nr:NAD(P)-dependent oxidoreductase [Candidatus Omnitrophota bacterium]